MLLKKSTVAAALVIAAIPARSGPVGRRVISNSSATISISSSGGNATFGPMYGYMWEDINNSGDGGLYAEMLQNRALQQVDISNQTTALYAWSAAEGTGIRAVNDTAGVSPSIPNSLKVTPSSGCATVYNEGYWGFNVTSEFTYKASFYAKTSKGSPSVTLSLVSTLDGTSYGDATISAISSNWTRYSIDLNPYSAPNLNNTFQVAVKGAETDVYFALFSLMPPTFKDRENGVRLDLAEAITATKPSVWRFPGGNNLEGQIISQRWKWNETLGPLSDRPGRMGDWAYINTDGWGFLEQLQWVEDIGAIGIMGVWAGYSFTEPPVNASDLGPYIQAALDQIEFAIGPLNSTYGALRASLGHAAPFPVEYIEVGNEDFFAVDSYVGWRWQLFHDAIQSAYPSLKILATTRPETVLTPAPKYIDEHVYETPQWFFENSNLFDNNLRPAQGGRLVFEGEYASTGTNESDLYGDVAQGRLRYSTLEAAVGEAAFMTGLERNSDLVFAASYAPMLENINRRQWSPNLILYDAGKVYLSASYHNQKLFSIYRGNSVLPSTIEATFDTNSTFKYVVSHSNTTSETFIKLANFQNSSISLSIDVSDLSLANATASAHIEYLTSPLGKKAENVPGEPQQVFLHGTKVAIAGGKVDWVVPGWTAAVVKV